MSQSVAQSNKGSAAVGTGVTATFLSGTTLGSTVVIGVIQTGVTGIVANTPTGPAGFTQLTQSSEIVSGRGSIIDVWYKDNESAAVTSYSLSGFISGVQKYWFTYEVEGDLTASSGDVVVPGSSAGAASLSIASGALLSAHEIVFVFLSAEQNNVITATGSPDATQEQHGGSGAALVGYKIVSATTSISLGGTEPSSVPWSGLVASFRAPNAQTISVAGTKVVAQIKQPALIKTVAKAGTGGLFRRFNQAARLATAAPALTLSTSLLFKALLSVGGTATVTLGRMLGVLLLVALGPSVFQVKRVAKQFKATTSSSVSMQSHRFFAKLLQVIVGTVPTVRPSFVHLQSIMASAAGHVALATIKAMILRVVGVSGLTLTRAITKRLFLSTPAVISMGVLQHVFITVFRAGLGAVTPVRLRLVALAAHGTASVIKLRAHLISVVTPVVSVFKVTVLKKLLVTGSSITKVGPALVLMLLVTALGRASLVRTRLVRILVVATHVMNLSHVRAWLIQVLGVPNFVLALGQIHLVVIKALLVGQSLVIRKHITKSFHMNGSGLVVIRVPRLLKVLIAVAKAGFLSLLTRKGDPTLGHATRFTINASDDTRFKITNET